jgi:hypothetical protein
MLTVLLLAFAGCSGNNDNSNTTATTVVPPPPRQVLRVETRPSPKTPFDPTRMKVNPADPTKPLLIFPMPNGKTFREGEEVVIDFALANAKLKGDGGEYRVRYIVDDGEMQWIDKWEQVVLTGWTPGNHTIRVELVGPDGWPYRNGIYNVTTRELTIIK